MKILAFSDLHRDTAKAEAVLSASREADVVVGAGDFCTRGVGLADTLDVLLRSSVPSVLVPGNHDNLAALQSACARFPNLHVLHGASMMLRGVLFYGLGFGSGVVEPEPWNMVLDEDEATTLLADCPRDSVLVSHSPPYGVCDRQADGRHDGSRALRDAIDRVQPKLVLCGHIHHSWGLTGVIGASSVHNLGPQVHTFEL